MSSVGRQLRVCVYISCISSYTLVYERVSACTASYTVMITYMYIVWPTCLFCPAVLYEYKIATRAAEPRFTRQAVLEDELRGCALHWCGPHLESSTNARTQVAQLAHLAVIANQPLVTPEACSGEGPIDPWADHFENLSTLNVRDYKQQAQWLAVRLVG